MTMYNNGFPRPVVCKFRRTIRVGRLEVQSDNPRWEDRNSGGQSALGG